MIKSSVLGMLIGTILILSTAAPPAVSVMHMQQPGSSGEPIFLQQLLRSPVYWKTINVGAYGAVARTEAAKPDSEAGLPANKTTLAETAPAPSPPAAIDPAVLDQLARVINGEARGESFAGKVAVGAVVLNRVEADGFPDSISEVIFQPGQFTCIRDGQYNLPPDSSAYEAAKAALNGYDPTNGALFYYNPQLASSSWSKKRPVKVRIDRHVFTD